MSLQDESFPHDDLFDAELSPTPLGRFQFPHRLRQCQRQQSLPHHLSVESMKNSLTSSHDLSTTSSSGDQTISSAESANEQPANVVTGMASDERMVKSDQTGMSSSTSNRYVSGTHPPQPTDRQDNCNSFSYTNLHSEYTKRRYGHVESKVGQYIANIRNEDARRRKLAQFQRHHTLPEIPVQDSRGEAKPIRRLQRSVTLVTERLNEALVGVIDNVEEESEEGEEDEEGDGEEAARSSVDKKGMMRHSKTKTGDAAERCVVADESAEGGALSAHSKDSDSDDVDCGSGDNDDNEDANDNRCIDEKTYALLLDERDRLQSYNDYQQLKLDEKQSEITRLRQNVDFLRVRLSNAEDQLKRNQCGRSMTLNGGGGGSLSSIFSHGGTMGGSGMLRGAGRHSLQGLLYCAAKSTKATQTESERCKVTQAPDADAVSPQPPAPPPPSPTPLPDIDLASREPPLLFVTPDTPDANNNLSNLCGESTTNEDVCARNAKNVATIQPMSLNFSNYVDGESAERRTRKDSATLRRRSNSLANRQKHTHQTNTNTAVDTVGSSNKSEHSSRTSHPSSSDSAIDVEVIELSTSPKPPPRRKRYTIERNQFTSYAPKGLRNFSYNRDSVRTPSPMGLYIERCPNSTAMDISTTDDVQQSARRLITQRYTDSGSEGGSGGGGGGGGYGVAAVGRKRSSGKSSLSRRWLYLFGSCIRCTNPRKSEHEQFSLQQTYTQVPLLETTFDRSCMELRSQ